MPTRPEPLGKADIEKILAEAVAVKARVDAEWAEGKRDGVRLGLFATADALVKMVGAHDAEDVVAFSKALSELGYARLSLAAHVGKWKRAQAQADGASAQAGEREG